MEHVINVDNQGNVIGIYTDALANLGKADIIRASEVEFNNDIQRWTTTFLTGSCKNACLLETFITREAALEAEVIELNDWLKGNSNGNI